MSNNNYFKKYIKYKLKYNHLCSHIGGASFTDTRSDDRRGQVIMIINRSIDQGVPEFNSGNYNNCARIYERCVEQIKGLLNKDGQDIIEGLYISSLDTLKRNTDDLSVAWYLRSVLDHITVNVDKYTMEMLVERMTSVMNKVQEESLICPISQEIMSDPVITSSGKTYERTSIQGWLDRGERTDPLTREIITTNLIPNIVLKSLIDELRQNDLIKK